MVSFWKLSILKISIYNFTIQQLLFTNILFSIWEIIAIQHFDISYLIAIVAPNFIHDLKGVIILTDLFR